MALWDLDDGALIRRFSDLPAGALDVVALGGGRVAAACFDGSIGVWEGDGRFRVLEGHQQAVTALCLVGDGRLVSGSRDTTLRIWDLATERCLTATGHGDWVTRVRAVGRRDFISAGENGRLTRRRVTDGGVAWSVGAFREPIWGLACDAFGNDAVVGAAGATFLVDLTTGTAERMDDLSGSTFRAIAFEPDSRTVAMGGDQGELLLYDVASKTVQRTLSPATPTYLSLAAGPDGRAVLGRSDGAVELVDGTSREVVTRAHDFFVYSSRASPTSDSPRAASTGRCGCGVCRQAHTHESTTAVEAFSLSAPGSADRLLIAGGSRASSCGISPLTHRPGRSTVRGSTSLPRSTGRGRLRPSARTRRPAHLTLGGATVT